MRRISQIGVVLVIVLTPLLLITLFLTKESSLLPHETQELTRMTIHIGNTAIAVDIADTPEEREQGLSGRERLGDNDGLLFVFDDVKAHGMWMKNMRFPIDIIWIDDDLAVVDIKADVSPDTFPEVFFPRQNARYVLEVNANFVEVQGIRVGDNVRFPRALKVRHDSFAR